MSIKDIFSNFTKKNKGLYTLKKIIAILTGAAVISFGMYNIHYQTNITEGGVLGMILLINHWTGISPSILSPMLDALCYAFAFKYLGWHFFKVSIISSLSFSGFFKLWEHFPPMLPDLSAHPLIAALMGGIFIGIGAGLVVRQGGSVGGDDALALTISKATHCRISLAYLVPDIIILLLSLSYIPLRSIVFSLVTVTVSSFMLDFVKNVGYKHQLEESVKALPASNVDINEFA